MKKYVLEVTLDDQDKLSINSTCEGFHGFEVLGFLDWKAEDIRAQLRDGFRPDEVERRVINASH